MTTRSKSAALRSTTHVLPYGTRCMEVSCGRARAHGRRAETRLTSARRAVKGAGAPGQAPAAGDSAKATGEREMPLGTDLELHGHRRVHAAVPQGQHLLGLVICGKGVGQPGGCELLASWRFGPCWAGHVLPAALHHAPYPRSPILLAHSLRLFVQVLSTCTSHPSRTSYCKKERKKDLRPSPGVR
jgi:hypothetical protein